MTCSLRDLLASHRRQLIHLLPKVRGIGIKRNELADELVDLDLELASFLFLERHQAGSLLGLDGSQHVGRVELQLRFGGHFRRLLHLSGRWGREAKEGKCKSVLCQ
jgi:hypothetical protein